jgi:hypothetical protein
VTIAAGFRFDGGIILCADTQETIEHSKMSVPKLRVEPLQMVGKDSPDDLMIAIAGSGDGPFIDKLIERAWEGVSLTSSLDEACSEMEKGIKDTYREYGQIFQVGYVPHAELIYGVKMHHRSKLFMADGPIVNERHAYGSTGAGYYMANFLASRMHHRYIPGPQAVILAAYVLYRCKEHVEGCGGDSHIALLNESGGSVFVDPWQTNFTTLQVKQVDDALSELFLSAPDLSIEDSAFKFDLNSFIGYISAVREAGREAKEKRDQKLAKLQEARKRRH